MGKIEIVKVIDRELIAIVESLAHRIWHEHYVSIIGIRQVEYMLDKFQSKEAILNQIEKEGYLYYLLKDKNNNWVGYFGVIPKDKELFLSKLYIAAEYRGQGYGKAAEAFMETIARDRGLSKISLTVAKNNTHSIKIYEKMGFVISGPIVIDIGNGFVMDDYRMVKVVPNC